MFQHTGQELADNLKKCMTIALKQYHKVNGSLPERIVVYRDGVGDGQVNRGVSKGAGGEGHLPPPPLSLSLSL